MTDPITTPEQMREAAAQVAPNCPKCGCGVHFDFPHPSFSMGGVFMRCPNIACDWVADLRFDLPEKSAVAPQPVAVTVKPLPFGSEELDAALAEYTPGIDLAVRFVTIDQVDALAEFYLRNRNATPARDVRALMEATDPDFIWGALDNVHDAETTLDDYAAAVSRAIRSALALIDKEPQP